MTANLKSVAFIQGLCFLAQSMRRTEVCQLQKLALIFEAMPQDVQRAFQRAFLDQCPQYLPRQELAIELLQLCPQRGLAISEEGNQRFRKKRMGGIKGAIGDGSPAILHGGFDISFKSLFVIGFHKASLRSILPVTAALIREERYSRRRVMDVSNLPIVSSILNK